MTAGVAVPPECPARRTHPDCGDGGSGDGSGKNGVGGGSSTGRGTTYDANGDRRRHCCPHGVAMADVMMTMAGERGGQAMVRRGDGEATARRRRCDGDKATTRQ